MRDETTQRVSRIREMAKTMTRNEICNREGITLATLKAIASKHAIKFQVRRKIGTVPNKAPSELEARLVVQIKDCINGGMNRSQCCKALAISYSMLDRIIRDHEIDFPKLKPAFDETNHQPSAPAPTTDLAGLAGQRN